MRWTERSPERVAPDSIASHCMLLSFGFAVLAQRTSTLTQAGMVVGTPPYMAPEQLLDEDSNARSDLYSAGVLL